MWWREFYFQRFYNKFEKNVFFKLQIFLMRYIENYIRLLKITIWKLKWRLVFIDRYPKWELVTWLSDSKINNILHNFFYRFIFPRPDITIVLDLKTSEIIKRKNELKIEEIERIKKKFKNNVLIYKKTYLVENNDLDTTLNNILKIIFSKWK